MERTNVSSINAGTEHEKEMKYSKHNPFDLDKPWVFSPQGVTEVTQCKNCDNVGGVSIAIQTYEDYDSKVLLNIICKLCGADFEEVADNVSHAKLILQQVVDLFEEEE